MLEVMDTAKTVKEFIDMAAPYADSAISVINRHNIKDLFGSLATSDKICGIAGALGLGYSLYNMHFWGCLVSAGVLKFPVTALIQNYKEGTISIPVHLRFVERVKRLENLMYKEDINKHRATLKALQIKLANEFSDMSHAELANIPQSQLPIISEKLDVIGKVIDKRLDDQTAVIRLKILFHGIVRCIGKEGFKVDLKSKFGNELREVGGYIKKRSLHNEKINKFLPDACVLLDVLKNGLQPYRFEKILPQNLALYAGIFAHNPNLAKSLGDANINGIETALRTQLTKFSKAGIECAFDGEARQALAILKPKTPDGQSDKRVSVAFTREADLSRVPRVQTSRDSRSETGAAILKPNGTARRADLSRKFATVRIDPAILQWDGHDLQGGSPQPPVETSSSSIRSSGQPSLAAQTMANGHTLAPTLTASPSISPPVTPRLDNGQKTQLTKLGATVSVARAVNKLESAIKKDKEQPKKPTPPPIDRSRRKSVSATLAIANGVNGKKA